MNNTAHNDGTILAALDTSIGSAIVEARNALGAAKAAYHVAKEFSPLLATLSWVRVEYYYAVINDLTGGGA